MIMEIGREQVQQFRALVAIHLGLQYEDGKLDYLADVLRQRMAAGRGRRCDAYLEHLAGSPRRSDELRALAEQLTVNETFFFRNSDHFRAMAELILPELIRAKRRQKRLRILSAGCSSGDEAYSLAVVVRELLPDVESWDVNILGLDINPAILAKAERARFSNWSLRATPEKAQRRYFRQDGGDFVLDPAIRNMVSFEERNLAEEDFRFWQSLACDVVFCRNVIMYFTPDVARQVVRRITQALVPGGFLFLGHAETLRGLTQDFHLCHTHDTFYYRLRDTGDTMPASRIWGESPANQAADSLPMVHESAVSWVDAIQRASERIATLSDGRMRVGSHPAPHAGSAGTAGPAAATRTWDLGLVLEAMRQERFADALAIISSLPPDSHADPDALLLRAVLLTNIGNLDESEEVCSRLLALDELNAGARYLMALCREHAGDAAGAAEQDQISIYLDPGFAMPHLHQGLMAARSGDAATAQRALGQALSLLAREDASRILLFGGGFSRETLVELCRAELRSSGGSV